MITALGSGVAVITRVEEFTTSEKFAVVVAAVASVAFMVRGKVPGSVGVPAKTPFVKVIPVGRIPLWIV